MAKSKTFRIAGQAVHRGETADIQLKISERYTGDPITLPIRVVRARRSGPVVLVTAAVHGDELNGMGIVHEIMFGDPLDLLAGTLVLVPVVNIFGFETQGRYMPDRRDLNRFFPGTETGSLAGRVAHLFFQEIVTKCDCAIDLHSAAVPRTNYPNVRGELKNPEVRRLARAFGCEIMIDSKGPEGSLRREATRAGCPTMIFEAGEPNKIEPGVLEVGLRGVKNVLKSLNMLEGEPSKPTYQTRVEKAVWVRAAVGGILRFHVSPGQLVSAGQPIATNASVFGQERNVLTSPVDGVVLGMTTLPTVKPGEPVCNIAIPIKSMRSLRKALAAAPLNNSTQRLLNDLATNVAVSELEGEWPRPEADDA